MKVRIKFTKTGIMRYIGHLDMVRYFQKAFRRSGIDIAYSQGFSPHQQMSFASPLGVGLTSEGEYMDVVLNSSPSSVELIERLNTEMAEGVRILSAKQIEDETHRSNAMAIIAAADYTLTFKDGMMPVSEEKLFEVMQALMAQTEILILKKTKKSEKEVNIRPMIYTLKWSDGILWMRVAAGSENNLKPELLMEAMCAFAGWDYAANAFYIHRMEMYTNYCHQFPQGIDDLRTHQRASCTADAASTVWTSLDDLGIAIQ